MTWQEHRIGDLCKVGRGSSPRPINDHRFFENGEIPWIKVADATASGKYLLETKERVNPFGASFSRLLPIGSLIICTSGTLGLPIVLGVEGCIHDGWLYTYDYEGLDPEFFYYFLQTQRSHFASVAYGAAIQNINTEILRNTKIRLPALDEQLRVADVLKSYDDLIENNRRRMALLEESARLLYREWFVRLRFPGHEHTRITDGVPEGWEKAKVGTLLAKIVKGKKIQRNDYLASGPIPCIDQGADFIGGYTDNEEARIGDPLPLIVFGDHTRNLKFVSFPFAIGADGTQLICPNTQRVTPEYFYFALKAIDLSNYFYARHFKFLKEESVMIPVESLVREFSKFAASNFEQINYLRIQNQKLRTARDLLLPRLMSGELTV